MEARIIARRLESAGYRTTHWRRYGYERVYVHFGDQFEGLVMTPQIRRSDVKAFVVVPEANVGVKITDTGLASRAEIESAQDALRQAVEAALETPYSLSPP